MAPTYYAQVRVTENGKVEILNMQESASSLHTALRYFGERLERSYGNRQGVTFEITVSKNGLPTTR